MNKATNLDVRKHNLANNLLAQRTDPFSLKFSKQLCRGPIWQFFGLYTIVSSTIEITT